MGLIDQQWQGILFEGDDFDREAARRQCRAYLCSVFPWLRRPHRGSGSAWPLRPRAGAGTVADPALRLTLPAWVYHSEEFHELEREHLFLSSWQVVCHVSELPRSRRSHARFEVLRPPRLRGARERTVSCAHFTMSAAHRAHAVVTGDRGQLREFLTCTYHGWTYHLDGRNRSVSVPDSFPKFDRAKYRPEADRARSVRAWSSSAPRA